MADMEIDSLKIEIASSSSEAEKSLYRLTQSLVVLRNTLGGLNFKSNGLNSFANSLRRLGRTTKDYDPRSINQIITSMKDLANISANVSSIATFTKSINSITRSADRIKETSNVFPVLSQQLQDFFNSMAGVDISDNTVRMAEALAKISKSGAKASTTLTEVNKSANQGVPVMKALSTGANLLVSALKKIGGSAVSGIKNLVTQLTGLGRTSPGISSLTFNLKNLLATVIGFRGITGLFNWTKESIAAGANLTEIDHIVESVFGKDMVDYVQAWSDSALESFGIASTAAKKYAGTMSAMFQASNIGMQDSGKMAMDLVELAGDLSAFYNIDTETAYNKLKSGMAGMVRPLRDLGIDLSATTLKEYALAQGIEKSYSAMTQGEKMLIRYKYLMEQTEMQQGDFARTSLSLANGLRILKAYASEVATQIGAGLGSAIRHVVIWLNSLMKYVLKAAQAFAIFMQTIFGKYKGGASGVNLDGALLDADDSASDLADSAEDAAGGIGDADDAAKKLKKDLAVLPFDELNQLAKDQEKASSSGSSGSGSGGGIGSLGDLGDFGDGLLGDAVDKIKDKLSELETFLSRWARLIKGYFNAKNWEGLGNALAWGINKGIDELYKLLDPVKAGEAINKYLDPFITTFNSFVDAIHWDILGKTIGNGISILVNAFNRLLDPETGIDFDNIGKSLGTLLNNAVKTINWTGVGELISNKFMVGWRVFKGFIDEFDATEAGLAVGKAIGAAVKKFNPVLIGHSLGTAVTKIATFMKNAFGDKETWEDLGTKIGEGINAFLIDLDGKEAAEGINAALTAITTTIGSMLSTINTDELVTDIADFIWNLDWPTIATLAAAVFLPGFAVSLAGAILKHALLKTLLTQAFSSAIGTSLTGAGTSTAITTGASTLTTSVGGSLLAGITSLAPVLLPVAGILGVALIGAIWGNTTEGRKWFKESKEALQTDIEEGLHGIENTFYGTGYSIEQKNKDTNDAIQRKTKESLDYIVNTALPAYVREMGLTQEEHQKLVSAIMNGDADVTKSIEDYAREHYGYTGKIIQDNASIASSVGTAKTSVGLNTASMRSEMADLKRKWGESASSIKESNETIGTAASSASGKIEESKKTADGVFGKMLEMASSIPSNIHKMISSATEQTPALAIEKLMNDAKAKEAEGVKALQTASEEIPKGMGKGVDDNINTFLASIGKASTEAHKKFISDNQISSPSKKYEESAKHIPEGVAKGVDGNKQVAVTAIGKLVTDMASEFTKKTTGSGGLSQKMLDGGKKVTSEFIRGLKIKGTFSADSYFKGYFTDSLWKSLSSIGEKFYSKGKNIAKQFADGLKSVSIPVPEIDVSSWTPWSVQTATETINFSIPNFSAGWKYYAKGGLFTKALPGILGEAGDEAAIPLENEKTMKRIAKAIVDNSDGSFGMSEEQLAAAVARGYVQAMMSNQGNERPINVNAVLYTEDNEVLARAVQRGNQSMDYRNNATPQFG